jgi:hypothetical protein
MVVARVIAITIVWLAAALPLEAATLTWDPSSGPNVAGYRVSYSTQPGVHSTQVDVGNVLTFNLTPPAGQNYYVVVQAYGDSGVSPASNEVIVSSTASTNQPPTLNQPANQSGTVGNSASLALTASDPENATLTFTAAGLPAGLTVNTTTRTISGTLQTAGTYNVTVTVSDGSLTASRSFTWIVSAQTAPTNQPPTLNQPPNQSGQVGSSPTLTLTASDAENAALSFTATGLPPGLSLNSATRTISGTLQTAGSYNVSVTVSDGSLTASRSFTWVVSSQTPPPVADTTAPTVSFTSPTNNESLSGKNIKVRATASDASGIRSLRYLLNGTAITGDLVDSFNYTWDISSLAAGAYQLQASAVDNAGNVGTATITVNIQSSGNPGNGRRSLSSEDEVSDKSPNGDTPVTGDFDGDGVDDPGTFTASTGEWRIWFSSARYAPSAPLVWGGEDDVPVPADYDGDGRADLAVYQPSSGTWSIVMSNKGNPSRFDIAWGREDDAPVSFDYDQDGRADLALRRPGGFDILLSGKGYTVSVAVR